MALILIELTKGFKKRKKNRKLTKEDFGRFIIYYYKAGDKLSSILYKVKLIAIRVLRVNSFVYVLTIENT